METININLYSEFGFCLFLIGFIFVLVLSINIMEKLIKTDKNKRKFDEYNYPEIPKSGDEIILENEYQKQTTN